MSAPGVKKSSTAHWESIHERRTELIPPEMKRYVIPEPAWRPIKKSGDRVSGGPWVRFEKPDGSAPLGIEYHIKKTGTTRVLPIDGAGLFTFTGKMACASFSLPAGPTNLGGTCQAAREEYVKKHGRLGGMHAGLGSQHRKDVIADRPAKSAAGKYVCDHCYAGKSSYEYANVIAYQTIRLWMVERLYEEHGISGVVDYFSQCLRLISTGAVSVALRSINISPVNFRIHDSGDFFADWYYEAWVHICEEHPRMAFWAPTRQWVFPRWQQLFERIPPPRNLALRPSALYFWADPPCVPGLAAGTNSMEWETETAYTCPAYSGGKRSCATEGCRTCWGGLPRESQDWQAVARSDKYGKAGKNVPVNYRTH